MVPLSPYLDIPSMHTSTSMASTGNAAQEAANLSILDFGSDGGAYFPPSAPLTPPRLASADYDYGDLSALQITDDFQSNALGANARDASPLSGLGIHCLQNQPPDTEQSLECPRETGLYSHWNSTSSSDNRRSSTPSLALDFSFPPGLFEEDLLAPSFLDFPWSLDSTSGSSNLSEFSSNASCRLDNSTRASSAQPTSDSQPAIDAQLADSLRELTALSGLSIDEFVAQLAATASMNLDDREPTFGPGNLLDVPTDNLDLQAHRLHWPSLSDDPGMPFPIADLNLRAVSSSQDTQSCIGVNPVDIMPYQSPIPPARFYSPSVCDVEEELHEVTLVMSPPNDRVLSPANPPSPSPQEEVPPPAPVDASPGLVADIHPMALFPALLLPQAEPEPEFAVTPPAESPRKMESDPPIEHEAPAIESAGSDDDPLFESPSSSEYSPSLEGADRSYQTRVTRKRKFGSNVTNHVQASPRSSMGMARGIGLGVGMPVATNMNVEVNMDRNYPLDSPSPERYGLLYPSLDFDGRAGPSSSNCDNSNVDLGTPVLDAHRGVDLEELKAKAERYRLRNHGKDYDKRWLLSFAGKLSARGELVEEFRCYVTGCLQTNKRRDHILIHVGAHLDQRPFRCPHCPARFLRKNECKRHELSHTGIRPYTCPLCPDPGTTFVRQDLLKRHMKRTHRMPNICVKKEEKEPSTSSRPRKRARTCV